MIQYTRASTDKELLQILALQEQNLKRSISENEIKAEGFVTVHHDFDLLKRMNDACPHIIAKDGGKVVGYALCMHPKFKDDIDILKPMFQMLEKLLLDPKITLEGTTENFVVMGQICIEKNYRRQGIFRKLYENMRVAVIPKFKAIVTEVNSKNIRSKAAHQTIGFQLLTTHESDGQIWELIYLV